MQSSHDSAPVPLAFWPAEQLEHEEEPGSSAYLPLSQSVQSSAESCKLARFPASLRYFPVGQLLQLLDPEVGA